MIEAIEKNLNRGIKLLDSITDEQYSNKNTPPYYSSIGSHMRHILDAFTCVFNGLETGEIDFSARERNPEAELTTQGGLDYFYKTLDKLKTLKEEDFTTIYSVTDDLGTGKVTAKYTLGSALMQVQSHTIHHYATIGFIVHNLSIELPDEDFGYNPTTPKEVLAN